MLGCVLNRTPLEARCREEHPFVSCRIAKLSLKNNDLVSFDWADLVLAFDVQVEVCPAEDHEPDEDVNRVFASAAVDGRLMLHLTLGDMERRYDPLVHLVLELGGSDIDRRARVPRCFGITVLPVQTFTSMAPNGLELSGPANRLST